MSDAFSNAFALCLSLPFFCQLRNRLHLAERVLHLANCLSETHEDGAGNESVTDVELGKMGNTSDEREVRETNTVPDVHFQTKGMGEGSGSNESLQFLVLLPTGGVGEATGLVQDPGR